ncbi:GCN5 family acetyltransferase [Streptomyces sp. CB02488]|uniref:GNAT family N-acetyltransferase n=1 Tax=Streptomyces sp. CB02488 TaxID=1703920 RepID=UPI00093D8183|nr:GNAT family N-acetyltransferase [Streptomyces sp. CB02488]OKK15505.1 GCN5 family acetyltransferase [Streptomyces sp. CB02488]
MTQTGTEAQVRPGIEGDLEALTDIYNHYVRETALTFDTAPFTPGQRLPWLRSYPVDGPHRLLVAQDVRNVDAPGADGPDTDGPDTGGPATRILGYATSSAFRPKAAYSTSVEVSVYCAPGAAGRGIGTLLYTALFEALAGEDLHRAYAGITQPNEASVRLHDRFGFRHLGTYAEVGRKFGRYWDVAWYEKHLGPAA